MVLGIVMALVSLTVIIIGRHLAGKKKELIEGGQTETDGSGSVSED
jgi:hypothetical protein